MGPPTGFWLNDTSPGTAARPLQENLYGRAGVKTDEYLARASATVRPKLLTCSYHTLFSCFPDSDAMRPSSPSAPPVQDNLGPAAESGGDRDTFWSGLGDLQGLFTEGIDEHLEDPTSHPVWSIVESPAQGILSTAKAVALRCNWWHAVHAIFSRVVRHAVTLDLPSPSEMRVGETCIGGVAMTKGNEPPGCANRSFITAILVLATRPWLMQTAIVVAVLEVVLFIDAPDSVLQCDEPTAHAGIAPESLLSPYALLIIAHLGEPFAILSNVFLSACNRE